MKKFVIQLIVFTLLFGSAEAAFCSVSMHIDHNTGEEQSIDNNKQQNEENDNQLDTCGHYCHCVHQLGMIFSHSFQSSQSFVTNILFDYGRYNSQPPPSLLRPPIV